MGAVALVNIAWRQAAKVWCLLLTSYCTGKITRCAPNFPVSKALAGLDY